MKHAKESVFVFGASGHAKVVLDIIEKQDQYAVAFLVDDNPQLAGQMFFGYKVIGGKEVWLSDYHHVSKGIVAIGHNRTRITVAQWLTHHGAELVSAIHPSSQLGRGVSIGGGSVLMAGAIVNSDTRIGENVIVNTRASIDHDCLIGNGAHIAPGTTLCGGIHVGECAFICAGSTVIPNMSVGRDAIIGAGASVICDIPDNSIVAGVPARSIRP